MSIRKLRAGRVPTVTADQYIGEIGSIFWDEGTGTLHLSDGVNPGGTILSVQTFTTENVPPHPANGNLWFDKISGNLFIYFEGSWVDTNPSYVLPIAGTNTLGGIKVGPGVAVSSSGILTIDAAGLNVSFGDFIASTNNLSTVNANEDLNLLSNGTGGINVVGKLYIHSTSGGLNDTPVVSVDENGFTVVHVPTIGTGQTGFLINGDGTINSVTAPQVSGVTFRSVGNDGLTNVLAIDANGTGVNAGVVARVARGTAASPSALQSGDTFARFAGTGYGTTNYVVDTGSGRAPTDIRFVATENYTDAHGGSKIQFFTSPTGGTVCTLSAEILPTGIKLPTNTSITFPDGSTIGEGEWHSNNGVTLQNHDSDFSLQSGVSASASGQAAIHSQNDSGSIQLSVTTDSHNNIVTISNNSNNWTFGSDGSVTLPSGAGFGFGESGQLKVNDSTTLKLDFRDNGGRGFYTNDYGVTIRSDGNHNFTFGNDGYLSMESLALQGFLKGIDGSTGSTGQVLTRQSNGGVAWADSTGGVSTSTRWDATPTEPSNNCPIYAELTPDHFQAFTQQSNLGIRNDGSWNIGSNYNGTGLYGSGHNATLYSNYGNVAIRVNDSQSYFTFGGDGSITFPDNTVQTTAYVTGNQLIWAATDNGHGSITQAVAYDSQGNSYSLISQGNINNSGVFPATIVKRSGTGSELWKIDLGTDHSVNPWSLVYDGNNNLYAIVQRLNGSVYNNVVLKLNGANGSILWQVDIQDSQAANNMQAVPFSGYIGMGPASGVIVAGTAYNGSDYDFFITALGADGSFIATTTYGDQWDQEAYSVAINPMSLDVVLVGRKKSNTDNAYYLEIIKFVANGPVAWQKSITVDGNYDVQGTDVCLLPDGNWAVLATHSSSNNNNYGVITMKINNTDGSVVWSREISQGCTNISSSIATDSAGNIYMSAMTYSGNNTPNNGVPITNRLIGAYDTNGNALWQKYFRTFDTSEVLVDPNWWNNIGSTGKQLAVYNDRLLVGTSVMTLGQSGPTGASAVVVQLTTQGENETIGAYETRNSYLTDSAVSLTVADTVFNYTTSTQTLSTGTSVSTANSTLTFSLDHTGAYVSQLKNGGKTVALETNGTLLDGNNRNVTGEFDGVTDSGNSFSNTPIGIRNASGYKRLVGLTNSAQTWFDINTVATQLGVNPAWIMGLTVEYQVTSSNFANIGSMTGQIIISSSNNSGRDISVTHSEAVLSTNNSSNDVVFANLNFWQPSGWTLQAVRTDSNSQQLDIVWTAKVFINASENYC
jgi:hypothetical protein